MKILVANAPAVFSLKDGYEKYFFRAGSRWPASVVKKRDERITEYLPFPFYLAYTTALLKNDNFDTHAIDAIALNWGQQEFVDYVVALKPSVLLMETTTPTVEKDVQIIQQIKNHLPKMIVCVSGSHVSTYPKETLIRFSEIDFVLQGEYEVPFLELMRKLRLDGIESRESLVGLSALAFRLPDHSYYIGEKGLNKDLDALPYPAWECFPKLGENPWDYYWDNICQSKPAAQMHSSRGCNFRCDFCVWIQVMYNSSKFRGFSPKRIVDEMFELQKRFGVKEIYFDDDMLTGNKRHVLELCKEIKDRGLKINWSMMGDAMVCDEEMIAAMADAGLIAMKFGVESGDARVLKEIGKPIKFDRVKNVCNTANSFGIKTHATFSFGLSGETRESMENTLKFMKELDVDTLQVSIATPFPGTKFYQKAKEAGLIQSEEWSLFDGNHTSVISHPHLSNEEIQNFATMARTRWLRSRVFKWSWVRRQFRIIARIWSSQGLRGVYKLFAAGFVILVGEQHKAMSLISKGHPMKVPSSATPNSVA